MNEACLNFIGEDLATDRGQAFAIEMMDYMRDLMAHIQEETGEIYNLEATPAGGTSHRLSMLDKKKYPDIISANKGDVRRGAAPYYTNSSQLHANCSDDIFETLRLQDTLQTTAMIFLILIGAEIFTLFLGVSKLPMLLADVIGGLPVHRYVILGTILLLYVILGCVLDGIAMIVLTIPILFPVITALEFDPIWFGVLMVIVLEMGLITPPVGLNVFVIKGVAKDVPLRVIFRGVIPFLGASVLAIIIIMLFPEIALFIPTQMR